ncbi:MAG: DNA replication/repair protein RecF [Opitutales bacterium]
MRFQRLRLRDFRNIVFTEIEFESERIFLLGDNGQGKSNLLEALGLVTAFRSFRTQNAGALPRRGSEGFAAVYALEQEGGGEHELELAFSRGGTGRRVLLDREPLDRLGELIGRFPVVPLCSDDLKLPRGTPADRRRFLDLTLSAVDPEYYHALRRYHRGVAERNRLLKSAGRDAELAAFESEIARHAVVLREKRAAGALRLGETLAEVYAGLAGTAERPTLELHGSMECASMDAVCRELNAARDRDRLAGTTSKGPHRDDLVLTLGVGGAREYASDGQQRGLCIGLRLAQARIFQEELGVRPVLLVDDVLGEMDRGRREAFWRVCPPGLQVIATGTELPDAEELDQWTVWTVREGALKKKTGAAG